MSAAQALRRLARGERPGDALLHTARLEALGSEHYGEEAILVSFRAAPLALTESATLLETPGFCALVDGQAALFAELADDNIVRLWRLSDGTPTAAERAVAVAFDPDLSQSRGTVLFSPGDHPALASDAAERVLQAARNAAEQRDAALPALRTRVFVVRAFGSATQGAALFAVYRLSGAEMLSSGFAMALAWWTPDIEGLVRDSAGEADAATRAWSPRTRT